MAAAPFVPPPDFVAEHGYLAEYEPRGVDTPEMADVVADGSPEAHSGDEVRGAALHGVKPTFTTVAQQYWPRLFVAGCRFCNKSVRLGWGKGLDLWAG